MHACLPKGLRDLGAPLSGVSLGLLCFLKNTITLSSKSLFSLCLQTPPIGVSARGLLAAETPCSRGFDSTLVGSLFGLLVPPVTLEGTHMAL